jgi:hypothetical protein
VRRELRRAQARRAEQLREVVRAAAGARLGSAREPGGGEALARHQVLQQHQPRVPRHRAAAGDKERDRRGIIAKGEGALHQIDVGAAR